MSKIEAQHIVADFHTHTIKSLDGLSTLGENIQAAKAKLKYLGLTDTYSGDKVKPPCSALSIHGLEDIQLIEGIELNIGQRSDFLDEIVKTFPLRLGGLHDSVWKVQHHTISDVKSIVESYGTRGYMNILAHPERELYRLNNGAMGYGMTPALREYFEWLIYFTKRNKIFLEVNERSLKQDSAGNLTRMIAWLQLAKENGNPIVLGSDAHYHKEIGIFTRSILLLNKLGYPKELVVNCDPDLIQAVFPSKSKEYDMLDTIDILQEYSESDAPIALGSSRFVRKGQ